MIRCIAVDDEALSLDLLEDNISRVPFLQLVRRCSNAYEAIEVMSREPVDLIFLDIQMPGLSGMQLVQSMTPKPLIIFITAYKKYALEGFELDVLDYLVKPVSFERFLKAVNKAATFHSLKTALVAAPATPPVSDFLFVNVEYNLVKIQVNDILFIEGLKDYVKIHLAGTPRPVISRLALKALSDRLPCERFVRVHKSYIVAIDKISSIRKNRICIDQHIIAISDSYREQLFSRIAPQNIK